MVDPDPRQEGRVYFGAWAKLQDENGGIKVFRLVGPDEFNPAKKWISIN
ncbi:Transcription elongation factor GreB [Arsenophonus endosymbiont of Bemisia tabaci Q2]|nr:Transcription elongation factor GreB [Arsenophonus endosymbiont of Bemisia tabaci Q2]